MKLTWFYILGTPECTACGSKLPRTSAHKLRRSLCAACTAELPYRVQMHLDRALRNRWYVGWWRMALHLLRTRRNERIAKYQHTWDKNL